MSRAPVTVCAALVLALVSLAPEVTGQTPSVDAR